MYLMLQPNNTKVPLISLTLFPILNLTAVYCGSRLYRSMANAYLYFFYEHHNCLADALMPTTSYEHRRVLKSQ